MATLTRELRRSLENTVREARRVAEAGARKVIEQLAVHHHEPYTSMTPEQRDLRNALRAHGRQLGDRRDSTRGTQAIERLTTECAYEHWHRMLFARFLAETNLLIEPESGMDITLEDCQELARERGEDWLELASQFAERMLPQIFRTNDPVLKLALPPETRAELENLLKALSREVFIADDSLGWVYQYWQADKKDEVNRSEKKIGSDELPAVTQLFTEDYMVFFLLHNTLGAWWAGKVLAAKPELASSAKSEEELRAACAVGGVEWTYLRFVRKGNGPWSPASGSFEGWPKAAKDLTVLDPCMGSGHFLVFALPILATLRAEEERLASDASIEAVLRDNLFGLEIDPRCTQIAAFNLALAAWRRVGYRALPPLRLACSGLSLGVSKAEWLKLAERAANTLPAPSKSDLRGVEVNLFSDSMKRGFERLYDLFSRAPTLGSLIDPGNDGGDLVQRGFSDLEAVLMQVMARSDTAELAEMAVAAKGLATASDILTRKFVLVATNVPYLARGKHDDVLRDYCDRTFPSAKADLATCFVERCIAFCLASGSTALVTPQNWLYQDAYRSLRKVLLTDRSFSCVAKLGPGAFDAISGEVVNVALLSISPIRPAREVEFCCVDVVDAVGVAAKAAGLKETLVEICAQARQLENADHRIGVSTAPGTKLLNEYASFSNGLQTGDYVRFVRTFWEFDAIAPDWSFFQSTVDRSGFYDGLHYVIFWEGGNGTLVANPGAVLRGTAAWRRPGVAVSAMGALPVAIYSGELYDDNTVVLTPHEADNLPAIWAFCSSDGYPGEVRKIDRALKVRAPLIQVPFDLAHWKKVADEKFPDGLPKPESEDPSQWVFKGNPNQSIEPLQVAVARLVGYQWPRQSGSGFPNCSALGADGLEKHADRDGIVTLSPVKGEQPASARLTAMLAEAFGSAWSAVRLDSLLAQVGFAGKSLDDWLRDGFFEQHCALFQQRPFVWHIWDGRYDGFHALVNYHRIAAPAGEGRRTLEKLIYSYLGDWIDRQRSEQKAGIEGADARLTAAEHLKKELVNILTGEPPYDIFVRWKALHEMPLGWEPDMNDGVRMNIRPFMTAKPLVARAKGTCILRITPKVKWEKDRGKESQRPKGEFPWFWGWDEAAADFLGGKTFDGNRWNGLHYSRAVKEAARARGAK